MIHATTSMGGLPVISESSIPASFGLPEAAVRRVVDALGIPGLDPGCIAMWVTIWTLGIDAPLPEFTRRHNVVVMTWSCAGRCLQVLWHEPQLGAHGVRWRAQESDGRRSRGSCRMVTFEKMVDWVWNGTDPQVLGWMGKGC